MPRSISRLRRWPSVSSSPRSSPTGRSTSAAGSVGDSGIGLRRAALVAASSLAIFVASSGLLVVVDEVRARGLALDLAGALAAVGVVLAVLVTGRAQSSKGS